MNLRINLILFFLLLTTFAHTADAKEIIEKRGGKVAVVKFDDGTWELQVDGQPYFIKGVVFTPVKIGENPGEATMRDWTQYDDDHNGINDPAFQTWLDKNKNNHQDEDEPAVGDFQLLKDMGGNTIRLYHAPSDDPSLGDIYQKDPGTALQFDHAINKELLRQLNKDYGIKVIIGNFLGSWTIGAGSPWEPGTDYNNPEHRENIKKSVRAMVMDSKDEPYVLFWVLGNENNIATWSHCNAKEYPEVYAKFIGELVDMVHELDPEHPVAVLDGDGGDFDTLKFYVQHAPQIDIIAFNTYRNETGLNEFWTQIKNILDRPIYIAEVGQFAFNTKVGEDENLQLNYIRSSWRSIVRASAAYHGQPMEIKGTGNVIGVTLFDWVDRWYMDGTPSEHNSGTKPWNSPDGLDHEEYFGLVSMGDGSDWLMRQERKGYQYLKNVWNKNALGWE